MEIFGLPLHPLVVHAAVVLAPLAAVLVALYAAVPRWRWVLRHPAAVAAVLGAAAVQAAAMTGDALEHQVVETHALHVHEVWAGRLQAGSWVLAGLAVAAWWLLPHAAPVAGWARSHRTHRWAGPLARVAAVLLPVAAVAVLGLVVMTGHAGAEAVWAGN